MISDLSQVTILDLPQVTLAAHPMSLQTRSRSDKNAADAKLKNTSLSAGVFIRSEET